MIFQALKDPKVCTCGATHHIATDPKHNMMGMFWNCKCKTTLFVKNENYEELVQARLNTKEYVKTAFKELKIAI